MLPPHSAVLDHQIEEMGRQLVRGNDAWFANRGIEVLDKDPYCLLRHNGSDDNHWNIFCNSAIFTKKSGNLVSLPVIKLYQMNSPEAKMSLSKLDIIEKVKGTMVAVCWPNFWNMVDPCFHTLDECNICSNDFTYGSPSYELKQRFCSQIDLRRFLPKQGMTATFQCDEEDIYLVGLRNNYSYYEYSEDELDILSDKIFAARPERTRCKEGWKTICEVIQSGKRYVIREIDSGIRAKLSMPLQRNNLVATLHWKYLIPYWSSNEQYQVVYNYPAAHAKFTLLDSKIQDAAQSLRRMASRWYQMHLSTEQLAHCLNHSTTPKWAIRIIIKMCKMGHSHWATIPIEEFRKMPAKRIIKILELQD